MAAFVGLVATGTAMAEPLRLDPPGDPGKGKAASESSQPEAEPADDAVYARMCDAFGEGFTYSPGTGACIKIGGYVKFGTSFGTRSGMAIGSGTGKFELR
jgi:hypothetical protein